MEPTDKGTYRYFKDPNPKGDERLEYTFYVIAIPGAVVVVSIASTPGREHRSFTRSNGELRFPT